MKTQIIISVLISSLITIPGCVEKEKADNKDSGSSLTVAASTDSVNINKAGYIIGLIEKSGKKYLQIDTVEFFTGYEAKKAIELDSKKKNYRPGIEMANGYYIRNIGKDISEFQIDDSAVITMQTFSFDSTGNFHFNEKVDYKSFINLFDSGEGNRYKQIPFRIEIKDGIILSIKEIYIPWIVN